VPPQPIGSTQVDQLECVCTTSTCGAGMLDAGAALRTATASTANYQGLWWNAPAGSESGWGINLNHQGNTIFATWFTFGLDGAPLWIVVSAVAVPGQPDVFTGDLYTGTGPWFAAFDPTQVAPTKVGTATFTFTAPDTATFAYTVNGISQAKTIVRQVFANPVPTCSFAPQQDIDAATNYQGIWWKSPAGTEAGWGVNLTHQGNVVFASWFTFGADGKPLWMVAAAQQTSPGVFSGTLVKAVSGPAFNAVPFDPAAVNGVAAGSVTLAFSDGNNATFLYQVDGIAQAKTITRQVFALPGTVCH